MGPIMDLLNNTEISRQVYIMSVSSNVIKLIIYFILLFLSLRLISRITEKWEELAEKSEKEKERNRFKIQVKIVCILIFFAFVVYRLLSVSWALLEWGYSPKYAYLKHLIKLMK